MHSKNQVSSVLESWFKEGGGRDLLKNLDMVELYRVSNVIKCNPSKSHAKLCSIQKSC